MSFSGSSRGSYRNGNYGSNHYQRKGGFLGRLLGGSFSDRGYGYNNYPQQSQMNYGPQQPTGYPTINQMVCARCNSVIPNGSAFCMQCGERVSANASSCISCGETLPPNAKFCLKCGSKRQG